MSKRGGSRVRGEAGKLRLSRPEPATLKEGEDGNLET